MTKREKNLARLDALGFKVASSLPTVRSEEQTGLRPRVEIASRLAALAGLFLWAGAPSVPAEEVAEYVAANNLRASMTGDELEILDLPRDRANYEFADTIGWRLENMWALAWVLGFNPEPALAGMIDETTIKRILFAFLGFPELSVSDVLARSSPRPSEEVDEMEDLFYCAHNAVRSAQFGGGDTVPGDFHPILDGGGIHERRHSLTWSLSPGVAWDETDLST